MIKDAGTIVYNTSEVITVHLVGIGRFDLFGLTQRPFIEFYTMMHLYYTNISGITAR